MKELDIKQVALILNRSTKSIRNYIKGGNLQARKVPSKKGLAYLFDPHDIESFAQKHLGISISIDSASQEIPTPDLGSEDPIASKLISKNRFQSMDGKHFVEIIIELEKEKRKLIEDFSEYKAKLAYKVGQLETELIALEKIKKEKTKLDETVQGLDKKYKDLEHEYAIRDEDARKLLKMKEYYEQKKWWQVWKGKYSFHDVEKEK